MTVDRVDIRAISGDRDPLEVAMAWLKSRRLREFESAVLYLLTDADRAEAALLTALVEGPRRDRVAQALGYLGRESSVPGLIAALDTGTDTQQLAVQAALAMIGGDESSAVLEARGVVIEQQGSEEE